MEKYNLNDLAMMTGFTTRTLRNYLNQGLLEGEKENGVWQFTPEQLDRFFSEPFVKEGLRIKRSSAVFDYGWDKGLARVILTGAADSVAEILKAYYSAEFSE